MFKVVEVSEHFISIFMFYFIHVWILCQTARPLCLFWNYLLLFIVWTLPFAFTFEFYNFLQNIAKFEQFSCTMTFIFSLFLDNLEFSNRCHFLKSLPLSQIATIFSNRWPFSQIAEKQGNTSNCSNRAIFSNRCHFLESLKTRKYKQLLKSCHFLKSVPFSQIAQNKELGNITSSPNLPPRLRFRLNIRQSWWPR